MSDINKKKKKKKGKGKKRLIGYAKSFIIQIQVNWTEIYYYYYY